MIQLRLLGSTELLRDETSVRSVLAQPKRVALLAYLALARPRGFHRRESLLSIFWPEKDEEHARNSLRQALHFLRKSLGKEVLLSRGDDEVRVNAELLQVDALDLEAALEAKDLRATAEAYRGDLLEGLHVDETAGFMEWLEDERTRLRRRVWELAYASIGAREEAGELAQALDAAVFATAVRPLSEESARALMRLRHSTGDRTGALRVFEQLARRLESEFETSPEDATSSLAESIRADTTTNGASTRHEVDVPEVSTPVTVASRSEPSWRTAWRIAPVLLVAVLAVPILIPMLLESGRNEAPLPLLGREAVVVMADLAAPPDDAEIARALTLALQTDLERSRHIAFATPVQIADALRRMALSPNAPTTLDVAMEIAQRDGYDAVVAGEVTPAGEGVVLAVQLLTPGSSVPLYVDREHATDDRDMVAAIDRLCRRMREAIGESVAALDAEPPLPDVMTPSFEALKAYTLGHEEMHLSNYWQAAYHFERAIELDSLFAGAWAYLGKSHRNRSEWDVAVPAISRAHELRDRLTPYEQAQVDFQYHEIVTGDIGAMTRAADARLDLQPHRKDAWLRQRVLIAYHRNDWIEAERFATELRDSIGNVGAPQWWNLVAVQLMNGHDDDVDASLDRWEAELGIRSQVWGARFRVAMQRQEWDLLDHLADTIDVEFPGGRHGVRYWRAIMSLAAGRPSESEAIFADWEAEQAETGGAHTTVSGSVWHGLGNRSIRGDSDDLRRRLDRGAVHFDTLDAAAKSMLIWGYAELGEAREARELLERYEAISGPFDLTRRPKEYWTALGATLLAEGRSDAAIRELRRGVESEMGRAFECLFCPVLVLARALDAAGRHDEAVEAYRTVADARWVFGPDREMDAAFLVPVHERLAHLYDARGELERAAEHYREVVRIWADAEPTLQPRVEAARAAIPGEPASS